MLDVLVIDDDTAIFHALNRYLAGIGIVRAAYTEDEALATIDTLPIDAIVLDGSLAPGTTTVDLLKKIRQKSDGVMIIAHSGEYGQLLFENGANAVVPKGHRAGTAIRALLLSGLKE